ncbi:MAG: YHS domain-containing protein [Acidimicrobiia bacterium]|nr:YHS domain-containing protein [Acidimicrobiia bacterium]
MQRALELAARLASGRTPFVLATVIWRRGPSSGHMGSKAVIATDGSITGWLGGACAEPTVIKQALDALVEGTPRLLQLGPPEEFGDRHDEDAVAVPMACESDGAMEVYLEPVVPEPSLVVIGKSPGAETLAQMGALLGWRAVLIDDGGEAHSLDAVEVHVTLDLEALAIGERDFVVVATQGHYDEKALEAALATSAGYVGLVASRKRAAAVFEFLRGSGISDEALARIHAPAGLDLGSLPNDQIAVAVLAEMVSLQAGGGLTTGVTVFRREEAIDPVCDMIVNVATASWTHEHDGHNYYFCAPGCRTAFANDPESFVSKESQ